MFENITILLSFVFAIALTHLLTSATELIWARDRVQFSGLFTIWMLVAGLLLVTNWLAFGGLSGMKHWSTVEVMLQFTSAVVQYFTCSLMSVRPEKDGTVELPAFYDKQRPAIMAAFVLLGVTALILNYRDAGSFAGLASSAWLAENAAVVAQMTAVIVAGWARPRWLQWAAAIAMLGLTIYFLVLYAIPG
ncbi:MAG TPA: hypothetical protein VGG10_05915 [Rhizomicrobium sp.]|jgi:hypothetical protein